jgi:chromosome segregation ATPase
MPTQNKKSALTQTATAKMPSPEAHLQALEKEVALLQELLASSKHTITDLNRACRDTRAEFNEMNKKHTQLSRAFEKYRTDLWSASSRMDQEAAARAEQRMSSVIEEQVRIQRRLPRMYRKLGDMVGARDSARESAGEYKDKVARKVEEMHTLRPCQSLTCGHCGRGGGTAALQKAKANFRNRMARILNAE